MVRVKTNEKKENKLRMWAVKHLTVGSVALLGPQWPDHALDPVAEGSTGHSPLSLSETAVPAVLALAQTNGCFHFDVLYRLISTWADTG